MYIKGEEILEKKVEDFLEMLEEEIKKGYIDSYSALSDLIFDSLENAITDYTEAKEIALAYTENYLYPDYETEVLSEGNYESLEDIFKIIAQLVLSDRLHQTVIWKDGKVDIRLFKEGVK